MIRPSRPPFANEYSTHPDGRPPWPRWWIMPPDIDETGTSLRLDHELNLIVLYVSNNPDLHMGMTYPDYDIFDEHGNLLLRDQEQQETKTVLNTPDILASRDRLFVASLEGKWHDIAIPSGFAKKIDDSRSLKTNSKELLVERLVKFSENEDAQEVSQWLRNNNFLVDNIQPLHKK